MKNEKRCSQEILLKLVARVALRFMVTVHLWGFAAEGLGSRFRWGILRRGEEVHGQGFEGSVETSYGWVRRVRAAGSEGFKNGDLAAGREEGGRFGAHGFLGEQAVEPPRLLVHVAAHM